ncbi:MAG TPA: DUF5312 family protein [Spirochaetia bacterium]|nr:DUF5312 family protein [Spirochaetia bacterium]
MGAGANVSSTVFDKLVSELSVQERQDLLSRMRFSQTVDETLLRVPEPTPESRFDRVLRELSFFERLMLFVRSILSGRERVELVQDFALRRLIRAVNAQASEFFSTRSMELLEPFLQQVLALQEAAAVFRKPLKEALGVHKKDFIAFLAGLELPVVQEHLLRETDPDIHDAMITELSEFDMKRALDSAVQDAFEEIAEGERQLMYRNLQVLHWLDGLSTFVFDRIASRFGSDEEERKCPGNTILGPLKELAAILQRLTVPPSTQLVSSVFLFAARDELSGKGFDLEVSLEIALKQAKEALAAVRQFNASVPLNDIVRIIVNETDWMPSLKGGGEDWFVLFKQFWSERLEQRVGDFVQTRTRRRLVDSAIRMLKLAELPFLSHYRTRSEGLIFHPAHEHSIAFLYGFLGQIFSRAMNSTVKFFLLDGKFYKDDNRQEFTDAFNEIERLPERLRSFDLELAPEGRRGTMLTQISDEHGLPASRQKAAGAVFASADRDAQTIVTEAQKRLRTMQLVLEGILHGQGEETYDTISNLSQIGGRENRRLLMSLRATLGHLATANEILGGFVDLESGRVE